jgi:hypothetical protein
MMGRWSLAAADSIALGDVGDLGGSALDPTPRAMSSFIGAVFVLAGRVLFGFLLLGV